jgi:glycosyltransferase involved in cell wall biosynthesis
MSESTAADEPRVWFKEFFKRRVVRLCATALAGGQRHKDYLFDLGMPREKIFTGYDVVDNDFFARSVREVRLKEEQLRNQHGLPEKYFLASARFIPKKNLFMLIRAYAEYRSVELQRRKEKGEIWSLVILGDGPLKSDLRSMISDLGLQDSVQLPGFKQYDELPVYYGLANAFVHASQVEQWGLVVNEAMSSALPVIVSSRCGCAPELVKSGTNGYTFDPADRDAFVERMLRMTSLNDAERAEFGHQSRKIIGDFAPERFADGLKRAGETALLAPRRKLGATDRLILNSLIRR